jgi:glutathione synthase/RimK-type ligase-like ATP-grasp enzyme
MDAADPSKRQRQLRVLLTEGASTSAREAVTALGLRGHHIEICDPDRHCLCRFSSFVRRFHHCPSLRDSPKDYLDFVVRLLETGQYDVLLPIHEQGLVFAKAHRRLPPVGVALPSFEAYAQALDKGSFSRLLSDLGIAQPRTQIVSGIDDVPGEMRFPFVLKRRVATASRGVWMIRDADDLARAKAKIGETSESFLVQEILSAPLEQAQAVFDRGRLVGFHAFRRITEGVGGAARKESVIRPQARADLERIAARLAWHGAFSVDYILHEGKAHFIDSNPRLVEPMSGVIAGIDLIDLLLKVSLDAGTPAEASTGQPGVRTHIALQALLGVAKQSGSRAAVLRECWRLIVGGGSYGGSREELTPLGLDLLSALPTSAAALSLAASPGMSEVLPEVGWGAGLLTSETLEKIREIDD